MTSSSMKAVYIIVNAGFAEDVVEFIRLRGSNGATIINARGSSSVPREIMGITTDVEKEMILTIVDNETTVKIAEAIKEYKEANPRAHGICFALPVVKSVGLTQNPVSISSIEK